MSRIKMQSEGKRPRFFPESGADEMMSMMLELMSEVWVLKERVYAVEQVAAENGLDLPAGVEAWQPTEAQAAKLAVERDAFIAGVTRSLAANNVPGLHLRRSLDAAHKAAEDAEVPGDNTDDIVRAA
ncbi:MAG: hypothetical protein HKN56_00475 [Gammaproteobacteria bacterium]|nr:hypothetical protein [Gammaproteobacteria bacterium]